MPIPHDGPGHDRQDPSPGWGPPPSGWDRQPLPAAGPAPVPPPQLPPPQKPGVIALRPLGFGDLLDGTFAVIRLAPIPTLLNAVLAQLLPALTAVLLLAALAPRVEVGVEVGPGLPLPPGLLQELEEAWPGYALGLAIYLLVQLVAGVLVIGPSTVAAMRATLGQRTGWGQALALSARAMPRLAVWNLLIAAALSVVGVLAVAGTVLATQQLGLAVALGLLLLCCLPLAVLYVWLAIKLCFAPTEMVARSLGLGAAMASSWRLVRGSWWRILGILLVVGIILALLSGLATQILGVLSGQFITGGADTPLTVGASVVIQAVVGALSMVLGQIMLTLLHVDARIRHERLDVVLHAESVRGPAHPIPGHAARRTEPPA